MVESRGTTHYNGSLPLAVEAERRTLESACGGRLSYYADERVSGRPLVLIHSVNAAASAYEMRPLFEQFRAGRPVYALDLPGFGFSERSDRDYTPALYTAAIVDFLKLVVRQPADVIALSLSGEFAASAALEAPEHFRTLTLISPTGFSARRNSAQGANLRNITFSLLNFPLWNKRFYDALVTRRGLYFFLQGSFYGSVDETLLNYAFVTSHQPGARHAPLHFISGRLFTPDVYDRVYTRLTMPVLVVYDRDPYTRFDRLHEIARQHLNWYLAQVAHTRGLPHWERLPETVRALEAFWNAREAVQRPLVAAAGW